MKKINIRFATILLVLGCFWLSPAVKAADHPTSAIVGLWNVHYFHGTEEWNQTYDQWHSDGLEFEVAGIAPGAMCQGSFKQRANGTINLFHVAWTFDATGVLNGYWEETQTNTVSADRQTYSGSYDTKFYDLSGNFLFEDMGTLTATRLPQHY
jgi:hypothetical protein